MGVLLLSFNKNAQLERRVWAKLAVLVRDRQRRDLVACCQYGPSPPRNPADEADIDHVISAP